MNSSVRASNTIVLGIKQSSVRASNTVVLGIKQRSVRASNTVVFIKHNSVGHLTQEC